MEITYRFQGTATCPSDDRTDVYEVEIRAGGIILVEDILETWKRLTGDPIYQEDLTQRFSAALGGAWVKLTGDHYGVETETVAKPESP